MFYLTLQHTYTDIQYALCNDQQILQTTSDDKLHASKNIIISIQELLTKQQLKLSDITFIAVNQGPGPFTTLRTVIATVNGIAFASHLPLVAVNGLEALVSEFSDSAYPGIQARQASTDRHPNYKYIVALLNAFGHDVYHGININARIDIGCGNYKKVLSEIHTATKDQSVLFVGNGASMYQEAIQQQFKEHAVFPNPIPQTCSIEQVSKLGYQYWQEQSHLFQQIEPLYLKIQY